VITGHGKPAGSSLVTHEDIDMVSLTGSPATGKWIAAAAADTLKRVHLELGGKAPVIVFDDVDVETALETIAATGLYNAGQDCTAATRVLASKKVYDDLVGGLAEEVKGYRVGDVRPRDDARSAQLDDPARARRGLPRAQVVGHRDRDRRQ
jgi:betaine-aldehyde dehydrogenase